ncbi:AI-2E family transporter [Maledivibacter halophilus]|uniref:Predicted PurR-regulated permease PerM n=1 Tax=Maledivibacter halophilus TaxID=36842 RepID=A0A1T5LM13_9FIRM|nr:AI-2E family transporter [Maledivibacter halophilus]SKC76865.1 Predicted PurR-regulated permease PerM [Maledivibacter halophilus]
MQIDKQSAKNIIGISFFIILLYWGINNLSIIANMLQKTLGYISPFLIGLCIAFILNIPMRPIENWIIKILKTKKVKRKQSKQFSYKSIRSISIVLTLIVFLCVIFLVMFIVIPEISRTIKSIKDILPNSIQSIQQYLNKIDIKMPLIVKQAELMGINIENINKAFLTFIENASIYVVDSFISIIGSIFSSLLNFFLGLVFSFYVLINKEKLANQGKYVLDAFLSKRRSNQIISVLTLTNKTFINFFTGQFVDALILGGLFWIGMTIFRFPYAMMISVLIAFTALIPVFGAFIGCAVGTFLILVSNPMQAVWFIVFFLIIQQIEGNFIYPKIVGSSVGLPPMWVLVAVTLGGSIMGVFGMLIFIPITSVLYNLFKETVKKRLKEKHNK